MESPLLRCSVEFLGRVPSCCPRLAPKATGLMQRIGIPTPGSPPGRSLVNSRGELMKTWISAVTAIAVLGCVEQAVAKGTPNDDLGSALSDLAAYARASGTLFVAEARCHTGNEEAIRASVLVNASAYVKPDKLQQL